MVSSDAMIVVRGSSKIDSAYAGVAHDATPNRYAILHVADNRVVSRTFYPASDRASVERAMETFRGTVYADERDDADLLSLTVPAGAQSIDLNELRRAKSEEEKEALRALTAKTYRELRDKDMSTSRFRGAAKDQGLKCYFESETYRGFTQKRGGFQDELGRCSDLTFVEARTPEWEERLQRAYRGFEAVKAQIRPGAKLADLNRTFLSCMDEAKDRVYGNVVHASGHASHEVDISCEEAREHDWWTIGVAVGDAAAPSETPALLYDTAMAVEHRLRGTGGDKAEGNDEDYGLGNSVDDYFRRMLN